MPQLVSSERDAITHAIELSMAQIKAIAESGGSKVIASVPLGGWVEFACITVLEVPTNDDCVLEIVDANLSQMVISGLAFDSILGESIVNNGTVFNNNILPVLSTGPVKLNVSNFTGNGAVRGRIVITLRILDPISLVNQ